MEAGIQEAVWVEFECWGIYKYISEMQRIFFLQNRGLGDQEKKYFEKVLRVETYRQDPIDLFAYAS